MGRQKEFPLGLRGKLFEPGCRFLVFGLPPELHLAPGSRRAAYYSVSSRQPPAWDDHKSESLELNPCSGLQGKPPLREQALPGIRGL